MKLIRFLSIPVFCLAFAFFSCSRAEPQIHFGFIELVYYPAGDTQEERFSFFILPEDDDGIENLLELYLYHDREGLRWLFTAEDWIQHEEDGNVWIGIRNIAVYGNNHLPRGQFRAVLVNRGGESTERRFTFDGPVEPPHPFPTFRVERGRFYIDSQYPVNRLVAYDQHGRHVQIVSVTAAEGHIGELRLPAGVIGLSLWAEDPDYRISAITPVVSIW